MASLRESKHLPSKLSSLYLMELTNWRWSWRSMIVLGAVSPIASVVFLAAAFHPLSLDDRQRIAVGVLMLAFLFENFHRVAGHYAFMRHHGTLEYYESLPVDRWMVLAAVMASFFTLSLLPITATFIAATVYLNLPLVVAPEAMLVLMVVALPISAMAAAIGVLARSGSEATSIATVVTIGLVSSGSVILREQAIPGVLRTLGEVNPISHAAGYLRGALYKGQAVDPIFVMSTLAMAIILFVWLERHLELFG